MIQELLNPAKINFAWNPEKYKQVEEAKQLYRQAIEQGRAVFTIEGKKMTSFRPHFGEFVVAEKEEGENVFFARVFDETGDRRLIWNLNVPSQIKEAMQEFNSYIEKGCKIYAVKPDGRKGKRVFGFDPELEEVFVDENSSREKFENFLKSFRQLTILPKAYPG